VVDGRLVVQLSVLVSFIATDLSVLVVGVSVGVGGRLSVVSPSVGRLGLSQCDFLVKFLLFGVQIVDF